MLIYDPVERANPTDMLSHVYLAELIAQIAQIAVSNKNAAVAAASGVSKENSSAMEVASGEDAGATATETAGTTEGTKTRYCILNLVNRAS